MIDHTAAGRRSRVSQLLLGGCLLAAAGGAQATDACLQAELAARPDFSGAVLVRQRGHALEAVQGQGDPAGAALRTDARFNLGSASKMFTAVAVVQLVAQGKLVLDAPIGRWVEGLAPPVAAVTLRQLLTHSAGLGNFFRPENLAALQKANTVQAMMTLVDDVQPQFEPGTRFRYSNTGFLLLGRAVERASGQHFAEYLQAHVFRPAGMTLTSMDPALPTAAAIGFTRLPEFAAGTGPGGPGSAAGPVSGPRPGSGQPPGSAPPPGPTPGPPNGPLRPAGEAALPGSPAGSAYSTVGDMARFFDALEAGKLVGLEWVKQLTAAQINVTPPGAPVALQYGLGFGISAWQQYLGYGHNGGAPGANVEAQRFPDEDLLIVVLANRDPPQAGQLLATLRQKALTGTLCR